MSDQTQVQRFMALFAGLPRAHGSYVTDGSLRTDGKREGKGITLREPVTVSLWEQHLAGTRSLGITPIRDDATVVFSAIDIDSYLDFDIVAVREQIEQKKLPLVVCRSKSGGAHLFLFASEPVPAELARQRLYEISGLLGRSGVEVFPKQNKLASTDDCGSWLNMVYYGGTSQGRYAISLDGSPLLPEEFLDFAEASRQPLSFFEKAIEVEKELFSDGPPCLQTLVQIGGFAQGGRNNLMVDVALYAKKGKGDWKAVAHDLNRKIMNPPLDRAEVDQVLSSMGGRRAYQYRCQVEPMVSHCNGAVCRLRPYGVGRQGNDAQARQEAIESFPRLGQLRILVGEPPVYFWDTSDGDKTLVLTSDEIQSPTLFQKKCIEKLRTMPTIPKRDAWAAYVREELSKAIEMYAPEDASEEGQIWELLEAFLTSGRNQAQNKKELTLGKPWTDKETGLTWFKLSAFIEYAVKRQPRNTLTKPTDLRALFAGRKLENKFFNIDGKGCRVWGMPAGAMIPDLDMPDDNKAVEPF